MSDDNNNNNNNNNNNDDDDDKGNQADIEGDDEDGADDHDCINDPTTQYRSFAAEVTPSNEVVSNACASTISAQEINHFSVAERKRRNAIIENSIPQRKHRKLEVPTHIHRQGQKNSLFLARTEAGQAIEKLLNAKKCPFEGRHNGLLARWIHAIHGYLHMLTQNNHKKMDASVLKLMCQPVM